MTEKNEKFKSAAPSAEEIPVNKNNQETDTQDSREITIPVKFNKEIRHIPASKAAELAQKGMKYDLISEEYKTLKDMSLKSGKSVKEFLEDLKVKNYNMRVDELTEKCGGDRAFAQHIANLENSCETNDNGGLTELQKYFPDFKSEDDLPEEIREAAELKGTRLLDEYLRYLLDKKLNAQQALNTSKMAEKASVGSQINRQGAISPEASQFLKGLWK